MKRVIKITKKWSFSDPKSGGFRLASVELLSAVGHGVIKSRKITENHQNPVFSHFSVFYSLLSAGVSDGFDSSDISDWREKGFWVK